MNTFNSDQSQTPSEDTGVILGGDRFFPFERKEHSLRDWFAAHSESRRFELDLSESSDFEKELLAKFQLICRENSPVCNFLTFLVDVVFDARSYEEVYVTPDWIQGRLDELKDLWREEQKLTRWLLSRHPELLNSSKSYAGQTRSLPVLELSSSTHSVAEPRPVS